MAIPPLRRTGALTPFERQQLSELQKRADTPPSAQLIDLQNRTADRERRARIDARLALLDQIFAEAVDDIAPQLSEHHYIRVSRDLPMVDGRALRKHLRGLCDKTKSLMLSWIDQSTYDPAAVGGRDPLSEQSIRAVAELLPWAAQAFASKWRHDEK
jgi:hypothetical protein